MPAISMESGGRNEETSHHLLGAGGRSMTLRVTAETWEKGGNTFNNQINIISLLSCLPSSQFFVFVFWAQSYSPTSQPPQRQRQYAARSNAGRPTDGASLLSSRARHARRCRAGSRRGSAACWMTVVS